MSLLDLVKEIEVKVGSFSTYSCRGDGGSVFPGQDIPFENKPAQQLLSGLGCIANPTAILSKSKSSSGTLIKAGNPSVTISAFGGAMTSSCLAIEGQRIDRLLRSAKVYINADIFPQSLQYDELVSSKDFTVQDQRISPAGVHWQNLAVGVCHVQEIDLLVQQDTSTGKAISTPKKGTIKKDDPALLLLSSPALNFNYGVAGHLPADQVERFIKGLYRNLFNATLKEGRNYIAMPAAGLGVFGGIPEYYFKMLMTVAHEFPQLNIIYHPAQFGAQFDAQFDAAGRPSNVVRATKDVIFIADELCKAGHPCSYHNPSDCDAVYGVYDIGEYWKTGKGVRYVGEEHIGSMTTAPLNSRGLNPSSYEKVVYCTFEPKVASDKAPPVKVKSQTTAVPDVEFCSDELEKFKRNFVLHMVAYRSVTTEFANKSKVSHPNYDSRYVATSRAATELVDNLNDAYTHFSQNTTPVTLEKFRRDCALRIDVAEQEFKAHLSAWDKISPLLKGILGLIAALTVIPALIVAKKSPSGYCGTFFSSSPIVELNTSVELLKKDIIDNNFQLNIGTYK